MSTRTTRFLLKSPFLTKFSNRALVFPFWGEIELLKAVCLLVYKWSRVSLILRSLGLIRVPTASVLPLIPNFSALHKGPYRVQNSGRILKYMKMSRYLAVKMTDVWYKCKSSWIISILVWISAFQRKGSALNSVHSPKVHRFSKMLVNSKGSHIKAEYVSKRAPI